jgi:hypothetical protein
MPVLPIKQVNYPIIDEFCGYFLTTHDSVLNMVVLISFIVQNTYYVVTREIIKSNDLSRIECIQTLVVLTTPVVKSPSNGKYF